MGLMEILKTENNSLYTDLQSIIKEASLVLNSGRFLHFTDHSISHSERILRQLDSLTKDLMSTENRLNEYELFVLITSVYLHDIGMQFDNIDILDKELAEKIKNSNPDEFINNIRKYHATISKNWILESINCNKSFRKIYFGNERLGEFISEIVESHTIDLKKELSRYESKYFGDKEIRLNLLACLLSLGDVLDLDHRRVDFERLKHIKLDEESKIHWYKHYYIDGVVLKDGILYINYVFPKILSSTENTDYKEYFSFETKYWILYNKESFKKVFNINYIRFDIEENFDKSATKKALEKDTFEYILKNLEFRNDSIQEKLRKDIGNKLHPISLKVDEEKDSFAIDYLKSKAIILTVLKIKFKTEPYALILSEIITALEE